MAAMERASPATAPRDLEDQLERHRRGLAGYCYRMLASPFDAEDAVQESLVRAWQNLDRFEGRSALRSWLYRIATNVCFDMLNAGRRRARPMDLGPSGAPVAENLRSLAEVTWVEPIPDPADVAVEHDVVRLAFVAALQRLPPRQRAVLILRNVVSFPAAEVAGLLGTSVAAVNSALQRARTTLRDQWPQGRLDWAPAAEPDSEQRSLLQRFIAAHEQADPEALIALLHQDVRLAISPRSGSGTGGRTWATRSGTA